MEIFIQVGYVSRRRGAKLHLDVDGIARCHSGGHRIIIDGELTETSAPTICRRCAAAIRTRLSWRSDDLYRLRQKTKVLAERAAIDALLDLEPGNAKTAEVRMIEEIRDTLRHARGVRPFVSIDTTAGIDCQMSLF